jgi:voltage-gated potassium channel
VLEDGSAAYQLFMLVLCIFALAILALQGVFRGDKEIRQVLEWTDNFVCALFFADFCRSLVRAPNRLRYFFTWGWLDLLSSIPTFELARLGRIARIARVARVLRALRATRALSRMLFRQRKQSAALAAALLALFLIVGSSAAILRLEDRSDATITSAEDALWWAFTTITTVGYGDRVPITGEGRIIAVILMTAGVGLFSAFSAALAAWFLAPEDEATDQEIAGLREEIATLRKLIEDRLPNRAPGG